ncbi:4-hydroxy-tetrahydrodipicolinate synthase [Amylibacter marinus]|uniref:4-hydroxy-tetrahydrodipicolinate synthase n=1 Tax=Amylibacter marinus TaxID=1475483 RepID=A0ABQ5VXB4_9RHOB|nr:4-hydroxy-tetrahydrodipicolinate synthase [Amylibacter marinus]GLQ35728.1 4-hydroxy-tetrahydrodipicolinate synthase [Amylibacter marinus]
MFKGSMPALITPMSNGTVDDVALKHLVDWQISQGSHGLVPVGTTGESATLSHDEHEHVIRVVVEHTKGRVPVIAGAGSNNTAEAVGLMQFAKDVGADAALVVTPYYNKPTQRGLYAHFAALNEIGLPIFIYNIPARSVIDLTPDTMGELAKLDNIIGVKDAVGSMDRITQQRLSCGADFVQMSAEDASALGAFAHGAVGCISVTANVAPKLCAEFQNALAAGDYKTALEYQDRLMPLHEAIFTEPGAAGAKYGASLLGHCSDEMRLPMTTLEDSTKEKVASAMRLAGILN